MVPEWNDGGKGERSPGAGARRAVLLALVAIVCGALSPAAAGAVVPANGRAWELVTPGEVIPALIAGLGEVTSSGTSLDFVSVGPMPGAQSGSVLGFSRAVRGSDGWTSSPLGFPYLLPDARHVTDAVPIIPVGPAGDRYSLVLSVIPLSSDPLPTRYTTLYRRLPDGTFAQVAGLEHPPLTVFGSRYYGTFIEPLGVDGAVFSVEGHLRPSDANRTTGRSIYESAGASLQQVDVGVDGTSISPCGSIAIHNNGISSDGSRIFFTSPPSRSSCSETSEVYLREGGSVATKISSSQCSRADCGPVENVEFVGATPDGRYAYLDSAQQLTNDDEDTLRDLYRYDTDDGELTLLSGGEATATGETYGSSSLSATDPSAGPLVYPSADGAYVYFYARGELATGDGATEGGNLYVAGPGGLTFIAPAEPEREEWAESALQLARGGEVALFDSTESAVGGDTDGSSDVYLYDAGKDALSRLSAGPKGGNGELGATITSRFTLEAFSGRPPLYRALSTDGGDAFFVTAEALVPEDVDSSTDVYEWRQGHLGLVSSGTGSSEDVTDFLGATPDGSSAFFRTTRALLPRDRDGGDGDIYVARVGGGFAEGADAAVPSCETAACLPGRAARLNRPLPPSAEQDDREGRIRLLKVLRRPRVGSEKGTLFELLATTPSSGRISVTGTEIGGSGKGVVKGSARASKAGKVRIPLRLSDSLERVLVRGGSVRVKLEIRAGEWQLRRTVTLKGGAR